MNPLIQFRKAIALSFIVLVFSLFTQRAQAVSPPPDGAYPNFTTAEGENALKDLTTGTGNTALGAFSLFGTTTGSFNTAVGAGALDLNTGDANTAVGVAALLLNTGANNTAVGVDALGLNNTGGENTATGAFALYSNTTGNFNTATGFFALYDNTTGVGNTANGVSALQQNTTGGLNTGVGDNALTSNSAGTENTATGANALFSNTTGAQNTANGNLALSSNTAGNGNTAIGYQALSNTSTSYNIAVGWQAGINLISGDSNIYIGSPGVDGDVQTMRIGDTGKVGKSTFIAGISGHIVGGGLPVLVDNDGLLGTNTSSARFKDKIKPMDDMSEAILALKPVTFRYKKEFDPKGTPQFGLVAEDVEKVNPDLVACDTNGEVYTVRYDAVNAMLLNEFLKAHRKIEEHEQTILQLKSGIDALTATMKEQAAQIQKVSAQLEVSKSTPRTVLNNQ